MARHFKPHDASLTAQIRDGQGRIFAEDREMLERQQSNLIHWPERRLMTLNIDAGGAHARRIIDKLIAAERAPAAAATAATAATAA
jgi:vanillate O-demethylase monooxygenase subunit